MNGIVGLAILFACVFLLGVQYGMEKQMEKDLQESRFYYALEKMKE